MGDIISAAIGGLGSIFGSQTAAKNELTGYNYLKSDPVNMAAQSAGQAAVGSQQNAYARENNTNDQIAQLIGAAPITDATNNAFKNYLSSTGYNFNLDTGSKAITDNAASRGLLNSGATGKALTSYGQNLGTNYFNTYLNQLTGLGNQQGAIGGQYGSMVSAGLGAANSVGQAGTTGGANAGQSLGTGITNASNILGGTVQNAVPALSNFLKAVPTPEFF